MDNTPTDDSRMMAFSPLASVGQTPNGVSFSELDNVIIRSHPGTPSLYANQTGYNGYPQYNSSLNSQQHPRISSQANQPQQKDAGMKTVGVMYSWDSLSPSTGASSIQYAFQPIQYFQGERQGNIPSASSQISPSFLEQVITQLGQGNLTPSPNPSITRAANQYRQINQGTNSTVVQATAIWMPPPEPPILHPLNHQKQPVYKPDAEIQNAVSHPLDCKDSLAKEVPICHEQRTQQTLGPSEQDENFSRLQKVSTPSLKNHLRQLVLENPESASLDSMSQQSLDSIHEERQQKLMFYFHKSNLTLKTDMSTQTPTETPTKTTAATRCHDCQARISSYEKDIETPAPINTESNPNNIFIDVGPVAHEREQSEPILRTEEPLCIDLDESDSDISLESDGKAKVDPKIKANAKANALAYANSFRPLTTIVGKKPKKKKTKILVIEETPHVQKKKRSTLSPFILFCKEMRGEVQRKNPDMTAKKLTKELAAVWRETPTPTKLEYRTRALQCFINRKASK